MENEYYYLKEGDRINTETDFFDMYEDGKYVPIKLFTELKDGELYKKNYVAIRRPLPKKPSGPFSVEKTFDLFYVFEIDSNASWCICTDIDRANMIRDALNESIARDKIEAEKHEA